MRVGALVLLAATSQASIALAQPQPEKVAARDPKLEAHLKGWQEAMVRVTNYKSRPEFSGTSLNSAWDKLELSLRGQYSR